jgi:hypothetical protein
MRSYRERHPKRVLLAAAKGRAKKANLPFNITESDIKVGVRCPVLGVRFKTGKDKRPTETSPTLDKIDPKKGYVRGNVVVICALANRIKSTANAKQIGKVARWLKRYQGA